VTAYANFGLAYGAARAEDIETQRTHLAAALAGIDTGGIVERADAVATPFTPRPREIAERLVISRRAVEPRVDHIEHKLGLTRGEIPAWVLRDAPEPRSRPPGWRRRHERHERSGSPTTRPARGPAEMCGRRAEAIIRDGGNRAAASARPTGHMRALWKPRLVLRTGATALALAVAGCGDGAGGGDDVGAGGPNTLVGTEWQLREMAVGGSTTAVPAELDAVVRFDGEGGWSAHGCNGMGGSVEIDGTDLSFADDTSTEDMACDDLRADVDRAVMAVLRGDVEAAIDGGELTLTGSGDDRLRLVVRDGIYPSRTMTPLDEGRRGEGDYRFGYERGEDGEGGPYAAWEHRAAPGSAWGFALSGPPSDPHRPDPLGGDADAPFTFVFGLIGADVTRVAYEPPSGEPTELALYPLGADGPGWQAYGGFVEQPVAGSHVVAYDPAGTELGRSVDLR
jgi:heat shock protein HslJ